MTNREYVMVLKSIKGKLIPRLIKTTKEYRLVESSITKDKLKIDFSIELDNQRGLDLYHLCFMYQKGEITKAILEKHAQTIANDTSKIPEYPCMDSSQLYVQSLHAQGVSY